MCLTRTRRAAPPDTKRRKRRRGGTRRRTDLAERGSPPPAQTSVIGKAGMARRGGAISASAALTETVLLTVPKSHAVRIIASSMVIQVCNMTLCF